MPFHEIEGKIVVVIDIFRASSAICTGIGYGLKEIIPVKAIEEALDYKNRGFIVAAERKGEVVEGFDFGNSPYSFMREDLKGKSVVLTTTNCTTAIHEIGVANQILIGSFVNISAIASYLLSTSSDVLLLCAGWKNRFNLEDTIFSGALASLLQKDFHILCDSTAASMDLYNIAGQDLKNYLRKSSHARRLRHLHTGKDIDYCLTPDTVQAVPFFDGHSIRRLN